jgi:hypothetical protein
MGVAPRMPTRHEVGDCRDRHTDRRWEVRAEDPARSRHAGPHHCHGQDHPRARSSTRAARRPCLLARHASPFLLHREPMLADEQTSGRMRTYGVTRSSVLDVAHGGPLRDIRRRGRLWTGAAPPGASGPDVRSDVPAKPRQGAGPGLGRGPVQLLVLCPRGWAQHKHPRTRCCRRPDACSRSRGNAAVCLCPTGSR